MSDEPELHWCAKKFPRHRWGAAIDHCVERQPGTLWVGNGEYESQVNYCPFCGYKAQIEAAETKD